MTDTIRHFLDLSDLSPQDVRGILDAAHARKKQRAGLPQWRCGCRHTPERSFIGHGL